MFSNRGVIYIYRHIWDEICIYIYKRREDQDEGR